MASFNAYPFASDGYNHGQYQPKPEASLNAPEHFANINPDDLMEEHNYADVASITTEIASAEDELEGARYKEYVETYSALPPASIRSRKVGSARLEEYEDELKNMLGEVGDKQKTGTQSYFILILVAAGVAAAAFWLFG